MKLVHRLALFGAFAVISHTSFAGDSVSAGYLWSPSGSNPTIIAGDDVPDPVDVFPFRVSAPNFTFVITDIDSNVLAYTTNNLFDLDGAGEGTCRIYGFAWSGEFGQPTGGPVGELASSEEFDLSRNRISIERIGSDAVDGGTVVNDSTGRGRIKIYLGDDPNPFRVYAQSTASSNTNYAFIITDADRNVLAFPEGNVIDLSGAPAGTCRVYGISYTGVLDTTTGIPVDEVAADSGNQSLSSNSIRADRFEGSKPTRRSGWWWGR